MSRLFFPSTYFSHHRCACVTFITNIFLKCLLHHHVYITHSIQATMRKRGKSAGAAWIKTYHDHFGNKTSFQNHHHRCNMVAIQCCERGSRCSFPIQPILLQISKVDVQKSQGFPGWQPRPLPTAAAQPQSSILPFLPSSLHKPRGDLAPSAFQGLTPLVPFKRLLTHRSTPGLFRQITTQQWPKFQRWHFTFCTWHIKSLDKEDIEQKHWSKLNGISII